MKFFAALIAMATVATLAQAQEAAPQWNEEKMNAIESRLIQLEEKLHKMQEAKKNLKPLKNKNGQQQAQGERKGAGKGDGKKKKRGGPGQKQRQPGEKVNAPGLLGKNGENPLFQKKDEPSFIPQDNINTTEETLNVIQP